MIDSTDPKVIEAALTYSQGKALTNSVNLEEGEERLERVVPLARRYGAALVVGCIDEAGMAVRRDRKLQEDQKILFCALRPEEIGVHLMDGCMMEPEASVSALVFHHPAAYYFSVA